MEFVACKKHGKPCMLKTGTKPGPNLGKSFYICSSMSDRCDYVKEARHVEAETCEAHGQMVELQMKHRSTQQVRMFYRCKQGKEEKKNWCGHWVVEESVNHSTPLRPKDTNSIQPRSFADLSVNVPRKESPTKTVPLDSDKSKDSKDPRKNSSDSPRKASSYDAPLPSFAEGNRESKSQDPKKINSDLSKSKQPIEASLPSFADLSQQHSTEKALSSLSLSSKPKPKSALLSRVQDAEEWRDSSGCVDSDDSDDDCVIVEEKTTAPRSTSSTSSTSSSHASSVSHVKDRYKTISSSSEDEIEEASPPQPSTVPKHRDNDNEISKPEKKEMSSHAAVVKPKETGQAVEYRKLPSGQVIRVVKKGTSAVESLQKPVNAEFKPPQQIEASAVSLPAASTGNRAQDIHKRQELSKRYQNHIAIKNKVNVSSLPDGGKKLLNLISGLKQDIEELDAAIDVNKYPAEPMVPAVRPIQPQLQPQRTNPAGQVIMNGVRQTKITDHALPQHVYQQMYASQPQMSSLYGGRMTAARLKEVGSVTSEAIERLHKQLEGMPSREDEVPDPPNLKIPLMGHQRQALRWLSWREKQHPPGGILADDMGLGKTLTMISLVIHQKNNKQEKEESEAEGEDSDWLNKKVGGGFVKSSATLIVCPASLVHQWGKEIERRCDEGLLTVVMYHGPNRESNIRKLADADVVLTTYNIISREVGVPEHLKKSKAAHDMPATDQSEADSADSKLLRIGWQRIVLDEAHCIKNHKSLTAMSVSRLRALCRWALTGTPIQNDLLDMYSLLRFLRCSPFDEYKVWKRQVDNKSEKGQKRLNMLVKTLLLRRTKDQTGSTGKPLVDLPERSSTTHEIQLGKNEKAVYDRIFAQSKKTMVAYLQKHEDKQFHKEGGVGGSISTNPWAKDDEPSYGIGSQGPSASQAPASIFKQNPVTAAQQGKRDPGGSQILLMLLRLRQCCSHLSLMREAVDTEALQADGLDLDLAQQLADMSLKPDASLEEPEASNVADMFEVDSDSSKVEAVMKHLLEINEQNKQNTKGMPMKSVVVSQWTKMLDVVEYHLKEEGIRCSTIKGSIQAKERSDLVDRFNTDPDGPQVMLISLRAGGVGLNLIGGNHLFLIDMHWNPALEQQACDRIYRMGQKRNVFIHRFICKGTVEEKILELQKKKLSLASNVLSGTRAVANKLSLADLRMLFGLDNASSFGAPGADGFTHANRHY